MELNTELSTTLVTNKTAASFDKAVENFLGNYIWRSVHALMDHPQFEASPIWISKKLAITVEEAAESLDGLVLLGLAQRTDKGFVPKQIQFIIPEQEMDMETRMLRHSDFSQQIMNRLSPEKKAFFKQAVAASNKKVFSEFYEKLCTLIKEFRETSEREHKDGLYCFTTTGVDIMEQENGAGGAQ